MNRKSRAWAVFSVTAILLLIAGPATALVLAEPDSVSFSSLDQSAAIQLTVDGRPIPANHITSTTFRVGTNAYDRMVTVHKQDGAIVVKPTAQLEMGRYDLDVNTTDGKVTIRVFAPLGGVKDTVEKQAAALGMSVDEYRLKYGLATTGLPHQVSINLAPVYYEGQPLVVTVTGNENAAITWRINGLVVKQGIGATTLNYVLSKPGDVILSYMAEQDGQKLAAATAATEVMPLPPVQSTIAPHTQLTFQGPAGYAQYTWKLDGAEVGHEQDYVNTFDKLGTCTVECMAKGPAAGLPDAFRHVTYRVTVAPAK